MHSGEHKRSFYHRVFECSKTKNFFMWLRKKIFFSCRTEASDKIMATDLGKKLEEATVPFSVESTVPVSKPFESHRRVLCFDTTASPVANTQGTNQKLVSQSKERNDISVWGTCIYNSMKIQKPLVHSGNLK